VTDDDFEGFCEVVVGFAELKGKTLSSAAIKIYWRALRYWPLDEFQEAATHLLKNCEFMPTPKDFEDLRKASRPTPGEAWSCILECARRGVAPLNLSSAAAGALRAIGGIKAVSMSPADKTHFLEKRFAEHFEQLQDVDDVRDALPFVEQERTRLEGPQPIANLLGKDDFFP
jgi:hypothetical protein